jgi:hypothetical protein
MYYLRIEVDKQVEAQCIHLAVGQMQFHKTNAAQLIQQSNA